MKKKIILGVILLSVLLVAGYVYGGQNSSDDLVKEEEFTTYSLKKESISNTLETTGIIQSKDMSDIYSKVDGYVKEIVVDEGEYVNKGDSLLVIDNSDILEKISKQESTVLTIENELIIKRQNGNLSLINNYNNSKIEYEDAEEIYNENKILFDNGGISQNELTNSHNDYLKAKGEYEISKSNLENSSLERDILLLEKNLETENKVLDNLKEDLNYTVIYAPFNGVVTSIKAIEGKPVSEDGELCFELMNPNDLEIITNISEFEIGSVQLGQNVVFNTLGNEEKTYSGEVVSKSAIADSSNDTSTIETIIDIIDEDSNLIANINVNLVINIEKKEEIFAVPYDALISLPKGVFIKTIDDELIPVETGIEGEMKIEIEGEKLEENMKIKIPLTVIDSSKSKQNPNGNMGAGRGMGGGLRK